MKKLATIVFLSCFNYSVTAQTISKVWVSDKGDGTYKNPVIHADYSDPDAIRVGDDYYMISSSFNHVPGLPILHSKDLVNWTLIGHALKKQVPVEHFNKVQHGGGVWAPSIRFHNNEFYIYYPDPDFGIYLIKAKNISGPWSEPLVVQEGKGLIDPCPLWDDNGKVYLVHAYAGSRAGIKSIIVVKELNAAGTKVISDPVLVYDGHEKDATIEGPKFYKRNGYYYIFAPAGGVSTGWQTVLRSKNVYGPYERRVVMDQGSSPINGPHQGAWVETKTGENWFLHFQDKEAYGRVVHLQPMKWINDWPVIGEDKDGDGKGEPVLTYKKPNTGRTWPIATIAEDDEFNGKPGLQWQWQANPQEAWAYTTANGYLKLFPAYQADPVPNLWQQPNFLGQKFPATRGFYMTAKVKLDLRTEGERFSMAVLGTDYAAVSVMKKNGELYVVYSSCEGADKGNLPKDTIIEKITGNIFYLKIEVEAGGLCSFYCTPDHNKNAPRIPFEIKAKPGKWVGAKIGVCFTRNAITNDGGSAELDWFSVGRPEMLEDDR
ncbi:MAG TPA: glycoside hydrolase 43 family protein [Chitinophagaceae bacterium]|jgi:beta-xylosidase|nr:glycoside hydrolase 43 family protein [Chitinophagaceae bacterium]